ACRERLETPDGLGQARSGALALAVTDSFAARFWLRGLSSISLEDRTCWCGRHGYGLRREVAHRKADVVNLRFKTDFRVFHPLLGRRWALLDGSTAASLDRKSTRLNSSH